MESIVTDCYTKYMVSLLGLEKEIIKGIEVDIN